MKLTKLTLEKLYGTEINASIWNGNFAIAKVEVFNNKKKYTLEYELSHTLLERFSGQRDKATFIVWEPQYRGTHFDVPEQLDQLAKALKIKAQALLDAKVEELEKQNIAALQEFAEAFCLGSYR